MSRIGLLTSEPVRPGMAGVGLRYLELARRLPARGIAVVLASPAEPGEAPQVPAEVRSLADGPRAAFHDCEGVVGQGQLVNDLLLCGLDVPVAVDLYDPWLVENFAYLTSLGLDPWRNDHATWVLQMSRGDLFLCSSPEQRLYYAGFLTALGRVNPERVAMDPTLSRLLVEAPFGLPEELPAHRPYLPPAPAGTRRILFGSLYDWYDPWTLLRALESLDGPPWELLLIRSPNPESTPQDRLREILARAERSAGVGGRVRALDPVPVDRRFDLLRDVDLMAAPHHPGLETDLSRRTRFLDALLAGCPLVVSDGGTVARELLAHDAGWVVPPGDPAALAAVLRPLLESPEAAEPVVARGRTLARELGWERTVEALLPFCREPWRDPTRERFAGRLPTGSPPDGLGFRLRRKLRRLLGPGAAP